MPEIIINYTSYVDVITNSSSEIFCTINTTNPDGLMDILHRIFVNYEDGATIETEIWDDCNSDYVECEPYIKIDLSYGSNISTDYLKETLPIYLDKYFKDNYTINYED